MIIEGAIAVKAAVLSGKRDVVEVYISSSKKTKDFHYIRRICKERDIPVREMNEQELFSVLSGKSHGGIGAEVSSRREDDFDEGDILFADGIEDPFNLGYVMRTAYAFGVRNVLLPKRDYSTMEAQLLKSSAGAYDLLNIRIQEEGDLERYKEEGYHLMGMFRGEGAEDIFEVSFPQKSLFILGGEKRGIKKEILALCDKYLYISYGSDFRNALNAAAAADVLLTLLYRQRRKS